MINCADGIAGRGVLDRFHRADQARTFKQARLNLAVLKTTVNSPTLQQFQSTSELSNYFGLQSTLGPLRLPYFTFSNLLRSLHKVIVL